MEQGTKAQESNMVPGVLRSTNGRDEPQKDTDLAIKEDATAEAAE